jgi:hypothetical protein
MNSLATATDVLLDTAIVLGAATALLWYFAGPQESAGGTAGVPRAGAAWNGDLSF